MPLCKPPEVRIAFSVQASEAGTLEAVCISWQFVIIVVTV
jgi:hypothetical protein